MSDAPASDAFEPSADGWRSLVDSGPLGLLLTDGEGLIRWANATLSSWVGLAGRELAGQRTLPELLAPGGRIYWDTHLWPLLHMQQEVNEIALELQRSDGGRLPVLVSARLRTDETPGETVVEAVLFDATERRRYETELLRERQHAERSEARLQVMYDVAAGLATAVTEEEIIEVVAQQGSGSLVGARCGVWMFGEERRSVRRLGFAGGDEESLPEVALPEQAPALQELAAGRLVVLRDREESAAEYPVLCEWMATTGVRSAVIAPVRLDGRLRGAISYGFLNQHDFDRSEFDAVVALATQTEQALGRAQLMQAEHRGTERLGALLDFTTRLSAALTLDAVVDAVFDTGEKALGATGTAVALRDHTGQFVDIVRGRGPGGRVGLRLPIDGRAVGCHVTRTGEPVVARGRAELAERFPDSPILADLDAGRVLAVPLRRDGEVLGAWVLVFPGSGELDADDRNLVELFAAQAAQATQRAALHMAENLARTQAEERRALSEVLNRAATTSDVAQAIAHEGQEAFGAAGLAVYVIEPQTPLALVLASHSGIAASLVAASSTVLLGAGQPDELFESFAPRFVVGASEVARTLDGILDPAAWGATAILPLGLADRALGLVVVGFDTEDGLTTSTRAALAGLAAEASVALGRARRFDVDHDVAITLQRSLLPSIDHLGEGWSVTTWYEPGSDLLVVGGDLFDLTELDDGRLVMVVGDVVGHGLDAAASMGLLRSAAKALALVTSSPAEVISGLRRFASATPGVRYSSIVCVDVRPDGAGRYASAGHPFPILRQPDGRTQLLRDGRSPLLGIEAPQPMDAPFTMSPGASLVLYTDGLVERRGVDVTDEVTRLQTFVSSLDRHELTARQLVQEMWGDEAPNDDIVVLCLTSRQP